jgi:hypothetical protein
MMAYGVILEDISYSREYKEMNKNNEQFDENGWYRFNHHFNADSLQKHFIRKDSLSLTAFYLPEEFDFLKNHLIPESEQDTFEVIYPLNSTEQRKFLDFSPTRNDFTVNSAETIKELNRAFHFYLDLGSDEIASCYITDKEIIIPYILIKSETIIAKPKPYIPPIPFGSYEQLLPTIKEVNVVDHTIDIGKPLSFVDTTEQFSNFLKTHSFEVIYTSSISTIDTNYELNHKIQYNFDLYGRNNNFYRHQFMKFYDISDIIQSESYYSYPEKERYFKPETKLRYKKKLDLIFKQLAKEHPEFMGE